MQGTLRLTVNQTLPNSTAVTVSARATFDVNGKTETIGSLAGEAGSSVTLGAGKLTTGGNNASTEFAGTISGSGGRLTKTGSGAWTLSGSNTYTGPTSVNQGTVIAASNNALGTAAAGTTVADGATLALSGGINYSTAEPLTISGAGVGGTEGALKNLSGSNSFAGPITMGAASTINSAAAGAMLTLGGNITGRAALTFQGPGDTTANGVLADGACPACWPARTPATSGIPAPTRGTWATCWDRKGCSRTQPCGMPTGGPSASDGGNGPDNTTLIYTGQIYLQGTTTFVEQNDDNTMLWIDGNLLINNNSWNNAISATYVAAAGWHDFEVRFSNGGGGYGFFNQQDTGQGDSNWDTSSFGFGMANGSVSGENCAELLLPAGPGQRLAVPPRIRAAVRDQAGRGHATAGRGQHLQRRHDRRDRNARPGERYQHEQHRQLPPHRRADGRRAGRGRSVGRQAGRPQRPDAPRQRHHDGPCAGTGTFSPGNSPGRMTINGDFTPSGTVNFEVNSAWSAAGSDYDQYVVNGLVDLSGATLTFTNNNNSTAPLANSVLTLIDNNASDATTLNGSTTPAQAASVTIGTRSFKIFYNGGTGNDVVLVEATQPAAVYVSPIWTGYPHGREITDGDLGTTPLERAVFGVNAFATVSDAQNAATASGNIIVNAGHL